MACEAGKHRAELRSEEWRLTKNLVLKRKKEHVKRADIKDTTISLRKIARGGGPKEAGVEKGGAKKAKGAGIEKEGERRVAKGCNGEKARFAEGG